MPRLSYDEISQKRREELLTLGMNIRTLIERRGWTMEELARQMSINPARYGGQGMDAMPPRMSILTLAHIADALDVSIGDLFRRRI